MPASLARLLDRGRAQALVDGFADLAPGGGIALVDVGGGVVASTGTPEPDGETVRAVHLSDGTVIGEVRADAGVPRAVVRAFAAAVQAMVVEIEDRRTVSLEALERYRETALLYRLAGTIGTAMDETSVVEELLAQAQRALRAEVALVIPAPNERVPAIAFGDPAEVDRVRLAIDPFLEAPGADLEGVIVDAPDGASVLATRVVATHGLSATLVLARPAGWQPFAAPDQRLALALAEHAGVALERVHLQAHDAERRRLEQELALGRRIQRSLLPQRPPDVAGWSFATHYEAATQVGGDFYDFFRLRDRPTQFGLVIADVTGKGIAAALLMAFARPLLRAIADQYGSPAITLTQANRVLVLERPTPLFITVFMGIVDSVTGVMRFASAGHEPALVIPAGRGRVRRLPGTGSLLGAFPTISLVEHVTRLDDGDLLLLHTDGAIDARDRLRRRFGDIRLGRTAGAARGSTAAELVASVSGAVARFRGDAPAADDLALLAVRRDPPS